MGHVIRGTDRVRFCIDALISAAALLTLATSVLASPADNEAASRAAMDARPAPIGDEVNPISPRTSVAVFEVDAEAGLHPSRPRAGDQKAPTDEGHAYWVRAKPSLVADIVDVGLAEGGRTLWLKVSVHTAQEFGEFTATHIGGQFALTLDGRIVGEPATIQGPITGTGWNFAESSPLEAYVRCLAFERVKDRSAGKRTPAASKCELRPSHGS
jgi:hypothetical protein